MPGVFHEALESIPGMAPKLAEARSNAWKKYPSGYLLDVANSTTDVNSLFEAIDLLIDTSSGPR
jgi:hypothetical protein